MSDNVSALLGTGDDTWNLPPGERARQAIPALRGYAYQLHQTLAAWIALPAGATLHLEVAEDYAKVAQDPATLAAVLEACQVKDTRESGAVTLNSPDVIDAVERLWALHEANPDRPARLTFLTTSPIGKERLRPLPDESPGLDVWRRAARGGPMEAIREALKARVKTSGLASFLAEADDEVLRHQLLRPLTWTCGAPPISDVESENRVALIELGEGLQSTPDMSARAADVLLARVLTTIVQPGSSRRLTRGDLLQAFQEAVTVRVPAQAIAGALTSAAGGAVLNLSGTGAWHDLAALAAATRADRTAIVRPLSVVLQAVGSIWIHGATGLGKSTLAELVAGVLPGSWRLLDLRGAGAAAATERIVAAAGAMGSITDLRGVIIDDLPSDLESLQDGIRRLRASLERRDALCIVTSPNPPGRRLERAFGLSGDAVIAAASFDEDEVASLVVAYGGDPVQWARFAWMIGGFGHPQLVDVVVSGLASRNWPSDEMQKWLQDGLKSEDVEAEREAARRRLLRELTDAERQFLYRATRINGAFDRDLALSVGRAPPALLDSAASLDRLSGHWIERVGRDRLRASPLVSGLDRQMLSSGELMALDREIVMHILTRPAVAIDLTEMALLHAVLARAKDLVTPIITRLIGASKRRLRSALASAMPIFRGMPADLGGLLADDPYLRALVRLAQFRLTAPLGDDGKTALAARNAIEALDTVEDLKGKGLLELMVLSRLLIDEFAFGKIPNWLQLVDRFAIACAESPQMEELRGEVAAETGLDPAELAFAAHAMESQGLADLDAIFAYLRGLDTARRTQRIAVLKVEPSWMSIFIDNPWLRQLRVEILDGVSQAVFYGRLAREALTWNEPALAAQCFRAQAIMLDEYAADPAATLGALDAADALLPDDLVLKRERAKVAWRAKDYASALDQISSIAVRLEAAEPLEASFALREAAISAGQLGRWAEAWPLFARSRTAALKATERRPTPFNIGLASDAAAARFASGDQVGAVHDMRLALEALAGVAPTDGLKAHYCHVLARHIVLWMQSFHHAGLVVDGQPVVYVPGSASNPNPIPEIGEKVLGPIQAAWMMLSGIALKLGVASEEVLSWPGVRDLRDYAIYDLSLRMGLLEAAIDAGSSDRFEAYAQAAVEALAYLGSDQWRKDPAEALTPRRVPIPALTREALKSGKALSFWREATLAIACVLAFREPTGGAERLMQLRRQVDAMAGGEIMPEWGESEHALVDPKEATAAVAVVLRNLAEGRLVSVEQLYGVHLRLLEFGAASNFKSVLTARLANRIRTDWLEILENRTAFLRHPLTNVPIIRRAVESSKIGLAYAADILLAAAPATRLSLSAELLAQLRDWSDRAE